MQARRLLSCLYPWLEAGCALLLARCAPDAPTPTQPSATSSTSTALATTSAAPTPEMTASTSASAAPTVSAAPSASAAPSSDGPLRFADRPERSTYAATFSPDGRWMATRCTDDCDAERARVLVWSLPSLTIAGALEPAPEDMGEGRVHAARFSPDGSRLALSTHNQVTLWRTRPLTEVARRDLLAVYDVVHFSRDGQWLAASNAYGTVLVLDAASGAERLTDQLHDGAASYSSGVLFSHGLLFAEGNANFGVYDPASQAKKLTPLARFGGVAGSMVRSTDDRQLVLQAHESCVARVIALPSLAVVRRFERTVDGMGEACAVAVAPSGAFAVVRPTGLVEILPPPGGGAPTIVRAANAGDAPNPFATATFSPDGRRLLWTWGAEGGVWNVTKSAVDPSPATPLDNARWLRGSTLEISRDEGTERFDVASGVVSMPAAGVKIQSTPFAGVVAIAAGDLELRRPDGRVLFVRAVYDDGAWRSVLLDPSGRVEGPESLVKREIVGSARPGAPYEVISGLGASFFKGIALGSAPER
jgi:hypothetical protein